MAALKEHVKFYIVQHLAYYNTPSEVSEMVKEEFDIDIPRNHVGFYDPTNHAGRELSQKFKDYFFEKRKAFLEQIDELPLASAHVRINELTKMYKEARKRKNNVVAKDILEQIAKEVGGFYTSKLRADGDANGLLDLMKDFNGGSIPLNSNPSTVEGEFLDVTEEPEAVKQIPKRKKWSAPNEKS